MKKITMIKMQGCPYCAKAAEAIEELRAEQPAYAGIEVEIIDENEQPELAKAYAKDYYYVPSLFIEGRKVYEAQKRDAAQYEKIVVLHGTVTPELLASYHRRKAQAHLLELLQQTPEVPLAALKAQHVAPCWQIVGKYGRTALGCAYLARRAAVD